MALAAALATLFWLDARSRIDATQGGGRLARRLRDIENEAREARAAARQSNEAMREAHVRVAQLEARLAESQSQQVALEALYQELSRNRDEWQLAETEQVLADRAATAAARRQRARRAPRVAARRGRLAQADRPQFLPIRRALARDIERLKALPVLDIAAMSARIDSLVGAVDSMPLAFDGQLEKTAAVKEVTENGFWARLGSEVWNELRSLVVVRQIGAAEPPLLPPPQAYFLRENLRLRLLNARASRSLRVMRAAIARTCARPRRGSVATSTLAASRPSTPSRN